MMKTIKIISDKDETNRDSVLKLSQDIQESYGWYLHGELEKLLDYDLGSIYNLEEFPENLIDSAIINNDEIKYIKKSRFNGIYPVEVLGVESPCIGYFWIVREKNETIDGVPYETWYQRGLVVLEGDIKGKKYAEKCYKEKRENI